MYLVFKMQLNSDIKYDKLMKCMEKFMLEALKEAEKARDKGEVPIGAVIVKDGVIIGRGHNLTESAKDPTAHAEILAIRQAAAALGGWRPVSYTHLDVYKRQRLQRTKRKSKRNPRTFIQSVRGLYTT